uniref:PDZ domain-containing protein n=1 Tax=Hanusia phi TaxID=3032 RepID=A0A6T7TMM8_9CRYP
MTMARSRCMRVSCHVVLTVIISCQCCRVDAAARDDWAEQWCELNDCYGVKEREKRQSVVEKVEKEHRKAARRYETTGEIRAIKTEAVQLAYFGYDGPVLDHPAFPGVANEHAERAERRQEEYAQSIRRMVEQRAISPPTPSGGYLLPDSDEARQLAVREQDDSAIAIARRRHAEMKSEVRMSCMYDYSEEPYGREGHRIGRILTVPKRVTGCAAGSVWKDSGRGGVELVSRTAESLGSVWRKVNGTDREWFDDVQAPPKGVAWAMSWKEWRAQQLLPYKQRAPPPCAPGYGGAFCKIELGTGADYVDEEDEPPPWAQMKDVKRLKQFWKEQRMLATGRSLPGVNLDAHRRGALPLAPLEYTAGTADRRAIAAGERRCECDATDLECIKRCTDAAFQQPLTCYDKCDHTGCHQECVHVQISFANDKPSVPAGPEHEKPAKARSIASEQRGEGRAKQLSGEEGEAKAAGSLNLCEAGHFSSSGQVPCEPCMPGSYASGRGALTCSRCERGSFQNRTGASSCESCGGDAATVQAGATSAKDCGDFAMITGVQVIEYEQQVDDSIVLDGSEEKDVKLNPRGAAMGPWYGGWWMVVYGKNLGRSAGDLDLILVGNATCKRSVWLSSSSSACMVPRGMGWNLPVTVDLKTSSATLEGRFSYEAPVIESYHPRNGAPRAGFWVTISGRNFGHVDTRPVAYLAGRVCLETYWISDSRVLCRGPPGVGGPAMLHHVDVTFEPAEHVQDMPRSLRKWVRSVLAAKMSTVSAKKEANPVVEIDVKAAADPHDKALARTITDREKRKEEKEQRRREVTERQSTSLAALKDEWNEEEQRFKQELAELNENKLEEEEARMASYLVMVEDRDVKREQEEAEARRKRREEFLALQEAERAIREQELAAMKSREQEEASRLEKAKGAMDKKLDKFKKAQESARRKKLQAEATEAMVALAACTELVTLDCKSGSCKLLTSAALASPLCKEEALARASDLIQRGRLEEDEQAQKVIALSFEIRRGLEEGEKKLLEAETALAHGLEVSSELSSQGSKCKKALEEAEAALTSAGLASKDALERVRTLRRKLEEAEREEAKKQQEEERSPVAACKNRELCSGNDTSRSHALPDKCGVGMGVRAVKEQNKQVGLEVTRLVDGSPASESGKIAVGDRLVMVDGEDVSALSPQVLAEERIMGERGTRVMLTVMRAGGEKVAVELTRR